MFPQGWMLDSKSQEEERQWRLGAGEDVAGYGLLNYRGVVRGAERGGHQRAHPHEGGPHLGLESRQHK